MHIANCTITICIVNYILCHKTKLTIFKRDALSAGTQRCRTWRQWSSFKPVSCRSMNDSSVLDV